MESSEARPPIYARWGRREFWVSWPRHRPDPLPGDIVRLDVDGGPVWRSFRVVSRRDRTATDGLAHPRVAIDLDVEALDPR